MKNEKGNTEMLNVEYQILNVEVGIAFPFSFFISLFFILHFPAFTSTFKIRYSIFLIQELLVKPVTSSSLQNPKNAGYNRFDTHVTMCAVYPG